MVDASLEAQIAERKQGAKDKKISDKAYLVARHFGNHSTMHDDCHGTRGNEYTFENNGLTIISALWSISDADGSTGYSRLEVSYRGEQVFWENMFNLYSYIPGEWENTLDELYEKARGSENSFHESLISWRERIKAEEEVSERAKWSL